MYRFFIFQRYHAENTSFKFINRTPEAETIVFLRLCFQWVLNDPNTPFFPEIRAFSQNLVLKIVRKPIVIHESMLPCDHRGGKDYLCPTQHLHNGVIKDQRRTTAHFIGMLQTRLQELDLAIIPAIARLAQ